MKLTHIRRTSGRRAVDLAVGLALVVGLTACSYGFEGGGFPPHIRTIYIAPFENRTAQFDLDQRLYAAMLDELPRKLGVRVAGEEHADAIIEGVIGRYDDVAQAYNPAAGAQAAPAVPSHEIQIGLSVRLVDVRDHVIRWQSQSLVGRGTYRPDTQNDEVGQLAAIQSIIEQIIDGAQSQW